MCPMAIESEEPSPTVDPVPWALPIVVRAERGAEPTAAAAIEATAMAVVRLLDDPRSSTGEWADAVQSWLAGRVRKVARRARGARWEIVSALPGVTVDWAGAQVRALLPTPTDAVPPEIGKLQVAGLDLHPGEPAPPAPGRLPVALTPVVTMSPLKSAVQAAHAAQFARTTMSAGELEGWRSTGFEVRLVRPDAATWSQLLATARVTVHDGGFTEVAPGTLTAIALWGDSVT
ncbi:MAG: hypothetical protein QOG69_613 [Actinomycetota bacterium]|nr:hypothetical protein [Actinomycetota bacterium]